MSWRAGCFPACTSGLTPPGCESPCWDGPEAVGAAGGVAGGTVHDRRGDRFLIFNAPGRVARVAQTSRLLQCRRCKMRGNQHCMAIMASASRAVHEPAALPIAVTAPGSGNEKSPLPQLGAHVPLDRFQDPRPCLLLRPRLDPRQLAPSPSVAARSLAELAPPPAISRPNPRGHQHLPGDGWISRTPPRRNNPHGNARHPTDPPPPLRPRSLPARPLLGYTTLRAPQPRSTGLPPTFGPIIRKLRLAL